MNVNDLNGTHIGKRVTVHASQDRVLQGVLFLVAHEADVIEETALCADEPRRRAGVRTHVISVGGFRGYVDAYATVEVHE